MTRFEDLDLYHIDHLLSEEERMVRDSVHAWVRDRVMPEIEEWAWEGEFPRHLVGEMADLDLLGASFDEYDLPGLNSVSYGLINQELEFGDSGLRSFMSVQSALVMYPILSWGSQDQKDRWIPLLGRGKAVGCFGLTEPDFGSNPGAMRTRAKRDGDDWILNGEKAWITNGGIADIAVVWARTDDGIRGFLVERGTPGFSTVEHKGKYSLRASVTSQLVFEDCRLPADSLMPGTTGLKNPLMCLTQARYGIAWGVIGSAMATFTAALDYAKNRIQFGGRPIAAQQIIQQRLVWMFNEIVKGQLLVLQLGRMKDNGTMSHEAVSLAKRNNCWVARECAKLAREIHGANGIVNEYPIMRHLMNIESVYTYEGTHDMHTLAVGAYLTGMRSFDPSPAE
ncbi:MAG: acyl-CoA dehydrogenase family protein [Acidobacteria bacterium]|jgi:glutaryl-CoA dehydrogenase|nr:acyl-CoA dehydrogenase family protein [Acidobacteriota bacterium]